MKRLSKKSLSVLFGLALAYGHEARPAAAVKGIQTLFVQGSRALSKETFSSAATTAAHTVAQTATHAIPTMATAAQVGFAQRLIVAPLKSALLKTKLFCIKALKITATGAAAATGTAVAYEMHQQGGTPPPPQLPVATSKFSAWVPDFSNVAKKCEAIPYVGKLFAYPKTCAAVYTALGCATVYTVKRIQLYHFQQDFLKSLTAAQVTADQNQWQRCQAIMRRFSPDRYPGTATITVPMAIEFVSGLRPGDMSNSVLNYVFPMHTAVAYALRKFSTLA